MNYLVTGASVYADGRLDAVDFCVTDGFVSEIPARDAVRIDADGCYIFPGFADVHVHLREPGFSYKETIVTGTLAAARGGYTVICAMPNLNPVPDCEENLAAELCAIGKGARIRVYPYGAITRGQKGAVPADMEAMADRVCAFSDDGHGVADLQMMRRAMLTAKGLGRIIAAHCEDMELVRGGCVHDGRYAAEHSLAGISSESEWRQLARDIELVRETGCAYHVCHVSCAESVALIRRAKEDGLDITCETAPHYLLLDDEMLKDEGRFKMNPPIREKRDRLALLEGLADGTVDMIATDHAPHSAEEKSRGLRDSLMGVSGLEAAFPALYTGLVRTGRLSLERLCEAMCDAPRRRFALPGGTRRGDEADFCIVDPSESFEIRGEDFASMGKATPFEGNTVYGRVKYTAVRGESVWTEM